MSHSKAEMRQIRFRLMRLLKSCVREMVVSYALLTEFSSQSVHCHSMKQIIAANMTCYPCHWIYCTHYHCRHRIITL